MLKRMLVIAPILQSPDWELDFHIFVDASHIAVGAVLMQEKVKGWYRPIYYASRVLSTAEKNYTVTEREALGMIYALKKFRHYLLGNKVIFHVDHQALLYLVNKPELAGRLARWVMLLQEFDYQVIHTPGRSHMVADYLSRLENGEQPQEDIGELPDAQIFQVEAGVTDNWYEDMLQFLTEGIFPETMSKDKRKKLTLIGRSFMVIAGVLYKRGIDQVIRRCVTQLYSVFCNGRCGFSVIICYMFVVINFSVNTFGDPALIENPRVLSMGESRDYQFVRE